MIIFQLSVMKVLVFLPLKTKNNEMKYGFIDLKDKIIATADYDKIELSPSKQTIKRLKMVKFTNFQSNRF